MRRLKSSRWAAIFIGGTLFTGLPQPAGTQEEAAVIAVAEVAYKIYQSYNQMITFLEGGNPTADPGRVG